MGNFWTKVVDELKTQILHLITFFLNCATYEIIWKNIVEPDRLHTHTQNMYRISRPIRRTLIFSLEILEKIMMNVF
jgi:hypothetical protein